MLRNALATALLLLATLLATVPAGASAQSTDLPGARAIGDTLTVVMQPILSVPTIVADGHSFTIEAMASSSTTGWTATLERGGLSYSLALSSVSYESSHERWFMTATVPSGTPEELYDLHVQANGGIDDVTAHSVMVEDTLSNDFYFIQIADTHLPTHLYYYQSGADTDTTEMDDFRAVIDDINIINPAFVLLTGDVINEGELEDFLDKRYFTRTKRILRELDVPIYLIAGNHDVGGWDDSPPSDGTARRNWWKFFGWRYLNDPPPGEEIYTQNYSFDYGGAHLVGIESYNNYDRWRRSIYGNDSFTDRQLDWLSDDLSLVNPADAVVLFYHMDFQDQLNLGSLGVDGTLWGHIHSSSGSIGASPFNLSTDNVCDGGRSMRLIRVEDDIVTPSDHIRAGSSGQNLAIMFDVPNDGTETEIVATVTNWQSEAFEYGRVKFHVPASSMPYEVDQGTITHSIVDGSIATYYVNVALPSMSVTTVTISPGTGVADAPLPTLALVTPIAPNPANSGANLNFSISAPGHVTAEVLDLSGRRVATLCNSYTPAGTRLLSWNLRDTSGQLVSSGVYFVKIAIASEVVIARLVVLR